MHHNLNHSRRIKLALNEMLKTSDEGISGRPADIALVNCNTCNNLNLELNEFLIARSHPCRSGSYLNCNGAMCHINSYQRRGDSDEVSRSINNVSSKDYPKTRSSYLTRHLSYILVVATVFALLTPHAQAHESTSDVSNNNVQHLSEIEDFTFYKNGSFLQIDAGKEWPFNSKREISFRFRTKSPHGLLVYQTFDHNKLHREEDQENLEIIPQPTNDRIGNKLGTIKANILAAVKKSARKDTIGESERESTRIIRQTRSHHHQQQQIQMAQLDRPSETELNVRHLSRIEANIAHDPNRLNEPLSQLGPGTITATASEKLVNSLFSSSHISTINGNGLNRNTLLQTSPRDKNVLVAAIGATGISSRDSIAANRNRLLNGIVSGIGADDSGGRLSFGTRSKAESSDGSPVLSSSTINSFSASLYELYIKLENGRLKIVYEFGSRLNQTFCGKSLNDDRWHRVDLKVDPEINQMVLTLDQMINVEIALSPVLHEDDSTRRNELVFTNSILYLGGLNNNASIVKNIRQRLYMAQFIGCLGQIMLKTDQSTESTLQPAPLDKAVMVKRGCSNLCNTDNYCLHKSTCVNYYTNTRCDCFGTSYEDDYCWQDKLTSLSMLGYSTLVYRIYDWRDRHHSNNNRFSIQFKTLARDSVLFFAYGDLSAQQALKNPINFHQSSGSTNLMNLGFPVTQVNISNLATIHRPQSHQVPSNNNYLAISLANGSLIVEISFGDQPVLLSNLLYDRIENLTASNLTFVSEHNDHSAMNQMNLADGKWHNVTLIHNGKQLSLHLDGFTVNHTILGKNNHLYFDPSIYIGGVPNFLLNETRALLKPVNLRYKFVGCMRSVYFNQQNILLDLKRGSQMVEYRDPLGKPLLNTCEVTNPNLLPLTLRSGKSYLTFQLSSSPQAPGLPSPWPTANEINSELIANDESKKSQAPERQNMISSKKRTLIEFEYKTTLTKHFLAGGHLRDLSYHDLGGFWTLQARDECQLTFTISSGLYSDPEQVLVLSTSRKRCEQNQWYKVAISIMSGDKVLNITRNLVEREDLPDHGSYTMSSSVELLHQVQIGGDLAKFDESSPIPFSGCIRHIIINGHSFDSRDFVTTSTPIIPSAIATNSPQNFTQQNPLLQTTQYDLISSKMAQGYVTIDSCRLVNPCLTQNPCKNGGLCKMSELGEPDCDCSKTGYTGRRCHFSIYKKSCQDLYLSGQRKSSFYLIDLDRNGPMKPIRVRCNMDSGYDHIETSLSHNLPAEYLLRRSSTADIYLDITYLAFHHMYTHDGFYLHDDADDSVRSQQDVMLKTLIGQSTVCKQQFRYECRSAPLNLGNKTWLEAPYPRRHRLISLDGINDGKCSCASSEKRCLDPQRGCNCDSGDPIWSEDSIDFLGNDQVGITRIVLLRREEDGEQGVTIDDRSPSRLSSHNVESQSRITLGDLKCYGTAEHGNQHEITFKTSDAYIEVPGWRKGDISFNFRTASNPPAIILYQLATSRNHGYFRLTLISDTRLLFEYIVNRRPRRLSLVASHRLNNGEWQQVFIEYDSANIRLTVNDDSVLVDLDSNDHLGTFEGPLFIGGAPSKYLIGDLSRRNGFTGCFKGLNINGRSIDLNDYLSSAMPTVISGCRPSCTKNLCQNGGKCIEYWGSYECECSNPIAHSGSNCEINLNTNSITFITPESHYVEQTTDSSTYPPYLIKSILLNIRTYQETALVVYAHDQFNNFIQLHKNGSSLVLTFNSNATIVSARIPIEDVTTTSLIDVTNQVTPAATIPNTYAESQASINQTYPTQNSPVVQNKTLDLHSSSAMTKQQNATQNLPNLELEKISIRVSNTSGSGQPIQVKIERHRLRTTFFVNNNFVVVERPLVLLTDHVQTPWLNPELELVRPVRSKSFNLKTPSRIFLANIDEHFSTRLPGFTGCIQGFSIDNQLFDFNRAHLTGEMKGDYKIGCKMHCDSFPCKNQGTCVENWIEDRIQCKCDATSYIGKICDEDVAAVFNGETSRFIYNINRKLSSDRQASQMTARLELERSDELNGRIGRNLTAELIPNKILVEAKPILDDQAINLLDVSFAFSSEANQSVPKIPNVQVLVWITQANSSRHFFLGLTSDGGLLIQEDYGNSMSLSRLIKKPEQPFNDGYRHMVKYSRFNQSIQITVDHQTYLPTMSIIATNRISKFSKSSLIIIGNSDSQSIDKMEKPIVRNGSIPSVKAKQVSEQEDEYVNYKGCISNLIVRMNGFTLEPLSEAFGQNFETININATSSSTIMDSNSRNTGIPLERDAHIPDSKLVSIPSSSNAFLVHDQYTLDDHVEDDIVSSSNRASSIVDRVSQRDVRDVMEIMVTQDVEQGKCASFKRTENSNEKRSINEPKFTQLLDPRPAYMDPPRIKLFDRSSILRQSPDTNKPTKGILFYSSVTFLAMVLGSSVIYAYILQVQYKSEKFRCETPFFHNKREDTPIRTPVPVVDHDRDSRESSSSTKSD